MKRRQNYITVSCCRSFWNFENKTLSVLAENLMTRLFFRYFILNFFHRRFWITNITLPAGRKIKINALTRRVSLTLMRNARERLIKCLVITKKCDFASYFTSKSENNLQKKKKKVVGKYIFRIRVGKYFDRKKC